MTIKAKFVEAFLHFNQFNTENKIRAFIQALKWSPTRIKEFMRLYNSQALAILVFSAFFAIGMSLIPGLKNRNIQVLNSSRASHLQRSIAGLNQCEAQFKFTQVEKISRFHKRFGPALNFVKSAKDFTLNRILRPVGEFTYENIAKPISLPMMLTLPFADNKGVFVENVQKVIQMIHDFSYDSPQKFSDIVYQTNHLVGQIGHQLDANTGVDEAILAASALGISLKVIDESAEAFLKQMAKLSPVLVLIFASILTNAPEFGAAIMSAVNDGVIDMAVATPIGSDFYNPGLLAVAVIWVAFSASGKLMPLFKKALSADTLRLARDEGWINQDEDIESMSNSRRRSLYFKGFRAMIARHFERGKSELPYIAPSLLSAAAFFGIVQPQLDGPHAMAYLGGWAAATFPTIIAFFAIPAFSEKGKLESLADSVDEEESFDEVLDRIEQKQTSDSIDPALQGYHDELYQFIGALKGYNESGEGSENFSSHAKSLREKLAQLDQETQAHYVQYFREAAEDPFLLGIFDRINLKEKKLSFFQWFKGSSRALFLTLVTGGFVTLGSMGIDFGANQFVESTSVLGKTGFGAFINSLLTSLPDATVAAALLVSGMTMGAFRSIRFSNYTNLIIAYIATTAVLLLH